MRYFSRFEELKTFWAIDESIDFLQICRHGQSRKRNIDLLGLCFQKFNGLTQGTEDRGQAFTVHAGVVTEVKLIETGIIRPLEIVQVFHVGYQLEHHLLLLHLWCSVPRKERPGQTHRSVPT